MRCIQRQYSWSRKNDEMAHAVLIYTLKPSFVPPPHHPPWPTSITSLHSTVVVHYVHVQESAHTLHWIQSIRQPHEFSLYVNKCVFHGTVAHRADSPVIGPLDRPESFPFHQERHTRAHTFYATLTPLYSCFSIFFFTLLQAHYQYQKPQSA